MLKLGQMVVLGGAVALVGCGEEASESMVNGEVEASAPATIKGEPGKADSSAEAVFLDFEFEGRVILDNQWGLQAQIENQMLYTIGHLNGDRSVGRLDRLELSNVRAERKDDHYEVTYTAQLPVAWGKKNSIPETYELVLPVDGTSAGYNDFTEAYMGSCVDWGAHDVDAGSMWYYYRPNRNGCRLDEADVFKTTATISPNANQTTGKFPEYDRIWADDAMNVVAVFGKYKDDATRDSDAGISAYNRFVSTVGSTFTGDVEITPAELAESGLSNPGVVHPYVTFNIKLEDGRAVNIHALLVDNVRTAGPEFTERYERLTGDADLIFYNGHAGLGANIRALAQKGKWTPGQYSVVFMNGCDTYAYVDSALWDARAEVNPDDPEGTQHLDIISNALPSFFSSMSRTSMVLINALTDIENPKTYEEIFAGIDRSQVVLVSGEEDNTFVPGGAVPTDADMAWDGFTADGALTQGEAARYETPVLPEGKYTFELIGTGDADLYVRIGEAPTTSTFDCRPYRSNSEETCTVSLPAAASVHVMVRGYRASNFHLTAYRVE
ncbi:MAG: PPC domain-containing protein [Bradymonadia bacterium]